MVARRAAAVYVELALDARSRRISVGMVPVRHGGMAAVLFAVVWRRRLHKAGSMLTTTSLLASLMPVAAVSRIGLRTGGARRRVRGVTQAQVVVC